MYDGLSSNVDVESVPIKTVLVMESGSFNLTFRPNKGTLDITYTNYDGTIESIRTSYPEQFVALCESVCSLKEEGTVFTNPLTVNIGYNED